MEIKLIDRIFLIVTNSFLYEHFKITTKRRDGGVSVIRYRSFRELKRLKADETNK